MRTDNEVESFLNITLEYKVNKKARKSLLTLLVVSVVEEQMDFYLD